MADNNSNRKRRATYREPGPQIEQQVVEGILKGIWWVVSLPFKKRKGLSFGSKKKVLLSAASAQQYAAYWNQVIVAQQAQPATRDLAIAEADKLLDAVLQELNLAGNTMGERLKAAESLFPANLYNQVWEAHKLRNRLAHEVGVVISEVEVKNALSSFQWGLRTLGVFV